MTANKGLIGALALCLVLLGIDQSGAFDDRIAGMTTTYADARYCELTGCTMTGAVTTTAVTVGSTGITTTPTATDLLLTGLGTGAVRANDPLLVCDGTCPSWSACGSQGDTCVEGRLEVDGVARFDGTVTSAVIKCNTQLELNSGYTVWKTGTTESLLLLDDRDVAGRKNLAVSTYTNRLKDHDHTSISSDPTIFINSALDPDTDNTRWGSLHHDGTSGDVGGFNIGSGSGPVEIGTASGFKPAGVTSDPCTGAAFPPGSLFWNATSSELCYCDGSSADLRVKDASTACF